MSEAELGGRYCRLLGDRTGLIKSISHVSPDRGGPPVYVSSPDLTNVARLAGIDEDEMSVNSVSGKGFTLTQSMLRCVGETVERYCFYYPEDPSELRRGCYDEIAEAHETVEYEYLDAYNLETAGMNRLRRDTPFHWTEGRHLLEDETVLLPDSLVWFHPERDERYLLSTSNGCATGQTTEAAVRRAILEAVERDAVMRTWCLQSPPTRIEGVPDEVAPVVSEFERRGYEIEFYRLTSTIGLPVVGCLLRNSGGSAPEAIFACSADLATADAMRGALVEVGQGWALAKTALQEYDIREINDRERFDDYKQNFLYYSCGDGSDFLLDLLRGGETTPVESVEEIGTPSDLIDALRRSGCQPVAFDLTTRDVRDAGLTVSRVFVPELIPLTPPSNLPRKHPELADEEITSRPHPYA